MNSYKLFESNTFAKINFLFSFFIFIGVFSIFIPRAYAETRISEVIDTNTIWIKESSPYILEGYISVLPDVTLTIKEGVIVKALNPLEVLGILNVEGTEAEKVYFTSWFDDELGDTDDAQYNEEGVEIETIPNIELEEYLGGGISISSQNYDPDVTLDYVVVRYANCGLCVGEDNEISVTNSIFEKNSTGIGIGGQNIVSISDSVIKNNNRGISISQNESLPNSTITVSGLSIFGNTYIGISSSLIPPLALKYEEQKKFAWFSNLFKTQKAIAQGMPDYSVDFRNTWWGDPSGPHHATLNPSGLGNGIEDDEEEAPVLFNPWITVDPEIPLPIQNPVIIVPGLLGTEISKPTDSGLEKLWLDITHNIADIGDQFMDALQFNTDLTPSDTSLTIGDVIGKVLTLDYSEHLVAEFGNQGYVEDTDIFLFPYDWRYGVNEDNVNKLKQKIADVLAQTNAEEVDIIAHSTGGLLVKKYVVENPADHNIDKTVFVGVPNTGAPKAIKALIQGDGFGVPFLAETEMKKIARNLPVAYDLSPSEQYFDTKGSYVKVIDQNGFTNTPRDLDFNEINNFLTIDHQLNAQALANAHNLHTAEFDNYDIRTAGIALYAINGCKTGTIGKFIESRHQNILSGGNLTISYSLERIPGDGTVPLESATNLPINQENKYYALEAKHAEMLSQEGIRQKIVNIISSSDLEIENMTQDISECKLNGRAISIFSPLSIDIVDQDGNHLGLSSDGVGIENNIPNADFQIIGEHKFVYLPTDEGQTYTISVIGTGTGTFTITDATIEGNNITQTQVFSDISVTPSLLGSISLSNNTDTTLSLDTDGNGITDETLQPSSVLDAEQSQDFVPEPPDNNPPQGSSQSSGGSFLPIASQNEPISTASVVIEATTESHFAQQKNILTSNTQTVQKIEQTSISTRVGDSSEESSLTANVGDNNAPITNAIVIITLSGAVGILLLAKNLLSCRIIMYE